MTYIPPISRKVTEAISPSRYLGQVICKKHPELNGERYIRNSLCVGCQRDKAKARRQHPEVLLKRRTAMVVRRADIRNAKGYEEQVNTTVRLLAIEIAQKKGAPSANWRDYWVDACDQFNKIMAEPVDTELLKPIT